jgi:hypothetical protein
MLSVAEFKTATRKRVAFTELHGGPTGSCEVLRGVRVCYAAPARGALQSLRPDLAWLVEPSAGSRKK